MTSLNSLQSLFQEYITEPTRNNINPRENAILQRITNNYGLDAQSRLRIYYDGYRLRLFEVLLEEYPKLFLIMDEEYFTQAFLHYLLEFPSTHFSLRWFGQNFARFLQEYTPFSNTPYLSEMARFECSIRATMDAKDSSIFTIDQLKSIPLENWSDLLFKFAPGTSLHAFNWNIPTLWGELENSKIDSPLLPDAITENEYSTLEFYGLENPIELLTELPTPEFWLIWRKDYSCQFKSLSPIQTMFAKGFEQGLTFGEICENLSEIVELEEVPQEAINCLITYINDACLVIE